MEVGFNGIVQEEEVQTKESHDLKSGTTQEEEVHLEIPKDLKGKGHEEKKKGEFNNRKRWKQFQHQKKRYPRYNIWKYNHKLNQWGRRLELQSKM